MKEGSKMADQTDDDLVAGATPAPQAPPEPPPREPRQVDPQLITYIEKSQDPRDVRHR